MTNTAELIDVTPNQELITGQVAEYQPFRNQVVELKAINDKVAFNYEDAKGADEAKKHIKMLNKSRIAVEKTRKEIKADVLERSRAIDGEANEIKDAITSMIEVHQKPLNEIAEREEKRVANIQADLQIIRDYQICPLADSAECIKLLEAVNAFDTSKGFEGYEQEARDAIASSKDRLAHERDRFIASEKQAAELAEAQAKIEAQEKAERERIAAEEAKKAAEADAERKRLDAEKLQKEADERARLKAQEEVDAKLKAAEAEKQRLAKIEEDRLAEEEAKQEAEKARQADVEHRRAVNGKILGVLVETGITEDQAREITTLIATGAVPNVVLNY